MVGRIVLLSVFFRCFNGVRRSGLPEKIQVSHHQNKIFRQHTTSGERRISAKINRIFANFAENQPDSTEHMPMACLATAAIVSTSSNHHQK
ncbi:unnamed protein product [Caenorhabditis angaria]|uniref:Uncharacterized protein n=1 Tax=Caenorhabditis angaria TaxID=860376 RepID=A0A9P1N6I6_9PELO|nr:unnamed protein product [Caenorhabditis angaria]